jgi:hypothetical protein
MQLQKAQRKQAVIKLALQGPSGSGKTYSSLLLAYGLVGSWDHIAVIDTENNSSHLCSHLGNFNVLSLSEPFSPERYIEALEACEKAGITVVIIDSISQEWEGSGGIIETHGNMAGNSFTNWNRVTPRHNAFVQKILQSPCPHTEFIDIVGQAANKFFPAESILQHMYIISGFPFNWC